MEVITIHVYNPTMVISLTKNFHGSLTVSIWGLYPNQKGVMSQLIGVIAIAMKIILSARPPMTMTFLSLASKTFGSVPFFLAPHQRRHLLLTSPPSNSAWLREPSGDWPTSPMFCHGIPWCPRISRSYDVIWLTTSDNSVTPSSNILPIHNWELVPQEPLPPAPWCWRSGSPSQGGYHSSRGQWPKSWRATSYQVSFLMRGFSCWCLFGVNVGKRPKWRSNAFKAQIIWNFVFMGWSEWGWQYWNLWPPKLQAVLRCRDDVLDISKTWGDIMWHPIMGIDISGFVNVIRSSKRYQKKSVHRRASTMYIFGRVYAILKY